MMKLQSTPPITPSPIVVQSQDGTFPLVETLPPPLVLGASAFSHEMPYTPDVNERLIYFAAALNSIYSEDGYDFSVLTENDFVCLNEEQVKGEVQIYLQSLPDVCGPAVQHFWEAIFELVLDAAQGCEYYEFRSQSDPRAENSLFSHHYFLYNKRQKAVVSLVVFGEGNMYRGDDGYMPLETLQYAFEDDTDSSGRYASSPEPEDIEFSGKNRDFYGF
ncbi:hypothetical protein AGDE_03689 [Angomonas deanei]|nr:hypothetical protein AGDE_11170 [Angomonas deanei]EPY40239.1 hypothetical protein AGDE_03689 [Angomonas deanei]|eukprot:EPY26632.1 hypothetical protein AGDE_11170 [Angomonas deanei]